MPQPASTVYETLLLLYGFSWRRRRRLRVVLYWNGDCEAFWLDLFVTDRTPSIIEIHLQREEGIEKGGKKVGVLKLRSNNLDLLHPCNIVPTTDPRSFLLESPVLPH
jgi:hypothetical protein